MALCASFIISRWFPSRNVNASSRGIRYFCPCHAFVRELVELFAELPHWGNGNGRSAKDGSENTPAPNEQELKKEELDEITGGTGGAGNGPVTPHH
jgi:hypothetical protein